MTRILRFDAASTHDQQLYKWLYSSVALGSGADKGEKGEAVTMANTRILDTLDSISDEAEVATDLTWPGLNIDLVGYNARVLHDGIHELELKESELTRLERYVDEASLRFGALLQRKFFGGDHGLFEFVRNAEKKKADIVTPKNDGAEYPEVL